MSGNLRSVGKLVMWNNTPPAWTRADGPESDIVISTRARLARNVAGVPFPGRAAREDLENVAGLARRSTKELAQKWPKIEALDVAGIDETTRSFLVDAHLVSPWQITPRAGGAILLEPSGTVAIMVNEEDHFRIQAILPGLQPDPAWRMVDELDDQLAKGIRFAYSDRLGYLTASISNLGTGLRLSAMMHLAGLASVGRLRATLRAAIELGVSVRGFFGEGSQGLGDLFQVSNEITLGAPERELVERVRGVAEHVLREERRAREELSADGRAKILRTARATLRKIRAAETISARDALAMLSPIRLVSAVSKIDGLSAQVLNELMVDMKVMHSSDPAQQSSVMADRRRAVHLRRRLRGIDI
jgi:protein arginine kinase